MDTSEAQENVEKLDDSAKNLHDRLENAGSAGRNIGDGISSGAGSGMGALNNLGGSLDKAGSAMDALGDAGIASGIKISSALDDAGKKTDDAFKNAASASDNMSASFAKNFNKASKSSQSFGSSVKTGIVGALDTAQKKVTSFAKKGIDNIKKVGNAFLHPIQTIKGKFSGAMKDAAEKTDNVGDEAKKSGKELDGMGLAGAGAGGKIKSGLGAALKVITAVAAAAVVVTGIAKFTTAAMDASKAAENISYSFDKTFGDSASDVEAWADNFSSAIHRSQSEVKSFLTTNKQFYEGLGVTGESADNLSKMTTSLAYDIGNKFGLEDAEALSGLQDAISGNADALSAYGVRLDDATLKQTALDMGLKGSLDSMDEATLAQVRFNAILEQTDDIQGNASKSIGGITGGIKALKSGWTDFLEKAGNKLAPTFDKIFGIILEAWPKVEPALMALVDLLASGFEDAAPIIMEFATDLLPQLFELLGGLAPILTDIGGQLLPVLSTVLGTVVSAIGPLMPLVGTLINTLLPPLADIFGVLVTNLLPPVAKLFGELAPVIDALSPILSIVASAVELVANAISGLIGWLTKGIQKVGEFAQGLKDSAIGKVVGGIGDGISGAAGKVKTFFAGNAKGTDNFEGGWTKINEAGDELIHAKHGGGVAYLPAGSAVIPASKTDDILSDDKSGASPNPNWIPVLLEGNPNINGKRPKPDNEPKDDGNGGNGGGGNNGSGGGNNSPAPLAPAPSSGEYVSRKVIDLNITISSPDGSVSQEVRDAIKREILEAIDEKQDDEFSNSAIQNGYAG